MCESVCVCVCECVCVCVCVCVCMCVCDNVYFIILYLLYIYNMYIYYIFVNLRLQRQGKETNLRALVNFITVKCPYSIVVTLAHGRQSRNTKLCVVGHYFCCTNRRQRTVGGRNARGTS